MQIHVHAIGKNVLFFHLWRQKWIFWAFSRCPQMPLMLNPRGVAIKKFWVPRSNFLEDDLSIWFATSPGVCPSTGAGSVAIPGAGGGSVTSSRPCVHLEYKGVYLVEPSFHSVDIRDISSAASFLPVGLWRCFLAWESRAPSPGRLSFYIFPDVTLHFKLHNFSITISLHVYYVPNTLLSTLQIFQYLSLCKYYVTNLYKYYKYFMFFTHFKNIS